MADNEVKLDWENPTKKKGFPKGRVRRPWFNGDLELLKELYHFFNDKELAKLFGRTPKTIEGVRLKYGLQKDKLSLNDCQQLIKKVPIIIVKPMSMYDEDVLQIKDLLWLYC